MYGKELVKGNSVYQYQKRDKYSNGKDNTKGSV